MNSIPLDLITAIPDIIEKTREACEEAADSALHVLFLIGENYKNELSFPLILSNGIEVWPLPAPWTTVIDEPEQVYVDRLDEFLPHVKKNAIEFNKAIIEVNRNLTEAIAETTPGDSAEIWNSCNSLARLIEDDPDYGTLQLSEDTKAAYASLIEETEPTEPV